MYYLLSTVSCWGNVYILSLQFLFSHMLKIPETIFRLPDSFCSHSHSKHCMFSFLMFYIIFWFWCLKCLTFSIFCTISFHLFRVSSSFLLEDFQVKDMSFSKWVRLKFLLLLSWTMLTHYALGINLPLFHFKV